MQRRLPPLNAVRVFEACARHLNFTRAAEELSVTHSAVSKQIAGLEDFVGEQLFDRSGSKIALTDEGRRLRDVVEPVMVQLDDAFSLHRRATPGSKVLRIATAASFAAQVLMPLHRELSRALPQVQLAITTSDRSLDLTREAVDVAIRYGRGDWPEARVSELIPGRLIGVVRTDLADSARQLPRIQAFADNEWATVDDAVRPAGPVMHLTHFVVALEAAIEGVGAALLPDVLVRRALASGQLRTLDMAPVTWPNTFHVLHPLGSRRLADIDAFHAALRNRLHG